MRKRMVAKMIADPALEFASFSKLAELIAEKQLFKPSPSASAEEWVASVMSAWEASLDETGLKELIKDFRRRLSPVALGSGHDNAASGKKKKRRVSPDELAEILSLHKEFVEYDLPAQRFTSPRRADLRGLDLQGLSLRGVNLTFAYLEQAFLVSADLRGAYLMRAQLKGAILEDAKLEQARLQGADLSNANLESANLISARLDNATLMGARCSYATFEGADLKRTHFTLADLRNANLQGADVKSADFKRALYNSETLFDPDFDPVAAGMIIDQDRE